jgi:hypothetical protein
MPIPNHDTRNASLSVSIGDARDAHISFVVWAIIQGELRTLVLIVAIWSIFKSKHLIPPGRLAMSFFYRTVRNVACVGSSHTSNFSGFGRVCLNLLLRQYSKHDHILAPFFETLISELECLRIHQTAIDLSPPSIWWYAFLTGIFERSHSLAHRRWVLGELYARTLKNTFRFGFGLFRWIHELNAPALRIIVPGFGVRFRWHLTVASASAILII